MKDKSTCDLKFYPLKLPFKNEGKIKVFSEKQKSRKFNTNRDQRKVKLYTFRGGSIIIGRSVQRNSEQIKKVNTEKNIVK